MKEASEKFRHKVAHAIVDQGITVTKAAERAGLTRESMSRIIHGHERTTIDRAERVAKGLGIDLADMV